MKKKFLISFLAALAATTLALGFSACKTDSSSGSIPETPGNEENSSPTPKPTPKPYPEASPETDFQYEVNGDCVTITEYLNKTATSVVIPETIQSKPVTVIGDWVFYGCPSLTSVTIPNSVTSFGDSAFYGCDNLAYNEENGLKYLGNPDNPYLCLMEASQDIETAQINNRCKVIYNSAFYGCSGLTSVTIPDSVTSIGRDAFGFCDMLTSVTIGNGVTSIGEWAFSGCSSLTSITIPDGVTSIGDRAFRGCSSLTSITIPDSVTSIGDYAFHDCPSLTSITIPNSVTSIGERAFEYCSRLTSVTIGNGVTSIGNSAFEDCFNLTSITIPGSVTSIGRSAFEGCSSLTEVYYKGNNNEWNKINISSNNIYLTSATIYYFSETKPTASGNFWHYGANGEIVKW